MRGGRLGATFASPGREKIEIDKEYGKPDQEKRYIISIEGCEGIQLVLRERSKRNCGVRIRKGATKEAKDHVENNPKSSEEGNRPSSSVGEVETTTGARSGSIGLKNAKNNGNYSGTLGERWTKLINYGYDGSDDFTLPGSGLPCQVS